MPDDEGTCRIGTRWRARPEFPALGLSAEVRGKVSEKISLVGFYDYGAVDQASFVSADAFSHSGAGIGVRYDLGGFGPLRVDLAYPVEGATGDGLQFYIGIGQAF